MNLAMLERIIIEFRDLFGEMQVIENDLLVRYRITLDPDRKKATVLQAKFEDTPDGYFNVGNVEEHITLAEIKNDPMRTELFQWFAHGVFGIPLKV